MTSETRLTFAEHEQVKQCSAFARNFPTALRKSLPNVQQAQRMLRVEINRLSCIIGVLFGLEALRASDNGNCEALQQLSPLGGLCLRLQQQQDNLQRQVDELSGFTLYDRAVLVDLSIWLTGAILADYTEAAALQQCLQQVREVLATSLSLNETWQLSSLLSDRVSWCKPEQIRELIALLESTRNR